LLGIFLAAPVIGSVRVVLIYVHAKLIDQDPFPPEEKAVGEVYPGEIDAILFDLDGTLIETDDVAVQTLARRIQPLQRFMPGFETERSARSLLMTLEAPTTRILAFLDRFGFDDDVLDLSDRIRRLRGLSSGRSFQPIDGVADTLRELSRRYYLGIVTTRSHHEAQAFLAQQNLTELVQAVTGRDDTWRIKPHPSPVLHTAEQLGVSVDRCLLVGDSKVDIEAARAAGARSVGVLSGFGTQDQLERAGADRVLKTTNDLNHWL
jgi:HAD superfamily hydrolase (TIGR01549 family)